MTKPNPGSDAAIKAGCTCAVLDNNHGKFPPLLDPRDGEPLWWMDVDCPLHGAKAIPVAITPDQFDRIEKGERP